MEQFLNKFKQGVTEEKFINTKVIQYCNLYHGYGVNFDALNLECWYNGSCHSAASRLKNKDILVTKVSLNYLDKLRDSEGIKLYYHWLFNESFLKDYFPIKETDFVFKYGIPVNQNLASGPTLIAFQFLRLPFSEYYDNAMAVGRLLEVGCKINPIILLSLMINSGARYHSKEDLITNSVESMFVNSAHNPLCAAGINGSAESLNTLAALNSEDIERNYNRQIYKNNGWGINTNTIIKNCVRDLDVNFFDKLKKALFSEEAISLEGKSKLFVKEDAYQSMWGSSLKKFKKQLVTNADFNKLLSNHAGYLDLKKLEELGLAS